MLDEQAVGPLIATHPFFNLLNERPKVLFECTHRADDNKVTLSLNTQLIHIQTFFNFPSMGHAEIRKIVLFITC